MWWTNPLWLLVLILIIPFLLFGNILNIKYILNFSKALKEAAHSRIIRLAWLRMISTACVVLVLAGTYAFLPTRTEEIAALIDVSESIGNTEKEKARSAVLDQIKNMKSADRIAVIAFAGNSNIVVPLSQPDKALNILKSVALNAPNINESDLNEAISTAGEMLSQSMGKRSIILFTDGHSTIGGSVLDNAGLFKIPIYTVPIGQPIEGFISRGLRIPNETALGENVYIQWETYSSRDLTIQAKIKLDNKLVQEKSYDIKAGNYIIPIELKAEKPGNHIVDIEASKENKLQYGNISGLLIVKDKPSVLIIYADRLNPALSAALSIQNFKIREQDTKTLPETPGFLNAYSAIILDNVPAPFLNKNQQKTLQNYTAGGGGLLVIGGEFSLGRGGYFDSILEEILPVNTDTRQRILYDKAEIIFVIDHSDSMTLTKTGNMTKYESALNGVAASVKKMNPRNSVGIVTFDTLARWTLPMTPASRKLEIIGSLSKIPKGGGTDMSKAFEQVIQRFSGLDPVRRHLIVITDGQTEQSNFQTLSRKLRKSGFTITTIGIGNEINESLLKEIAEWGEGIFYHVKENDIPRIIKKESTRVTRELINEGEFKPVIKTSAEWINGVEYSFPVIYGYIVTKPKNLAVINLEIGMKDDPLLAWWRYGNGKVAVFTSDSGYRWLSSWSGSEYYNLLFSQTVRSIARGKSDKGLRATAYVEASKAYLIVDAFGQDRNLHSGLHLKGRTSDSYGEAFLFQETAYGRYKAEVPLINKGLNVFNISQEGSNSWTTAWVWNPPGKEMDSTGPDISILSQLSARTGGRIMSIDGFELPETGWKFESVSLYYSLLLIALFFFLLELFLRSTSMNQLKAAKAFLLTWWSRKQIIIQKAYNLSKKQVKDEKKDESIYDMD